MAVPIYIPKETEIVHETKVDFVQKNFDDVVHLVQYDKSLPIVAVHMFYNGGDYILPPEASVKIRWANKDKTYSINYVKGCNPDRNTVYFEVTRNMTEFDGENYSVLELFVGEDLSFSSYIHCSIDRNPVQTDMYETHIEPSYEERLEQLEGRVGTVEGELPNKQEKLISGQNIKTIGGESILGSGDIPFNGDDKHYVYTNSSGATEWIITHNLNKYPSVTVVEDVTNIEIVAGVRYIDLNTVAVTFSLPINGKAYLN